MANPVHLAILKQGTKVWNKWREENQNIIIDLSHANILDVKLSKVNLSNANLSGAKLAGVNLVSANLSYSNLVCANLVGANLKNAKLVASNIAGANFTNAKLINAELSRVKTNAYIFHSIKSAVPKNSDLKTAEFLSANFISADLSEASLAGSELDHANFTRTNLSGANLSGSMLNHAIFVNTTVNDLDLSGAFVGFSIFADVDFSTILGVDTMCHVGPSTIGIDTLYKSKGKIPESFLRGCGVSDQMIEYARSLTSMPIDFYSCFISYSTKDEEFAKRIRADLQANNVRCWFAPHDMQAGKKVHHQIDDAIRVYDKLLLILSVESMKSNWVGDEIIKAKKKEDRQGKQMLFPIGIVPYDDNICDWEFFDSDSGRDLAREIREYHIPDFSTWKTDHDAYKVAFERLLRALRSEL